MMVTEQQRAADALAQAKKLKDKSFNTLYRSYVDRIGPAIIMNGLGQALATERAAAGARATSDGEKAHQRLYDNLEHWLCHEDHGVYTSCSKLLQAITENDESMYLRAQSEALAWLEWHKKFCRAFLPRDGGNNE